MLTPDDFGLVALGTSLLVIVSAFTDKSIASALVQHPEPTSLHYHTAWTLGILRGAGVAVVFAAMSVPVAAAFGEPRLARVMLVLSVSIFLAGLANPRAIMMTRDLVFWQQFMLEVSQKVIGLVVSLAIAFAYRSYWALLAGTVIGEAFGVALSYTVLPFRPRFELSKAKEIFSFSLWVTLGRFINTLNWRLDHLLIGGYIGRAALGLYSVGDNLAATPTREIMTPLTGALFPGFAHIAPEGPRLAHAYQRVQALTTSIVLPIGVGMALVADPLVRLAMGEKWLPAIFVVEGLASVFALQTMGSLAQPLAMAAGETRLLFARDLQSVLLRVPLVVGGLLLAGLPGVVYARVLAGVLAIGLNMNVVTRITNLPVLAQLRANVRALLSAAVMAVCVLFLDAAPWSANSIGLAFRLASDVVAGAIVYVSTHFALWRLSGSQAGPERELLDILVAVSKRVPSLRS